MRTSITRTGKPGRPKSPEVAARDERVYQLVAAAPQSRGSLAQATGLERTTVYLSLQRLHKARRIRQCLVNGAIVWTANDGTPCP